MLPVVAALTASSPSGVIGCDVLHGVGTSPFGLALPVLELNGSLPGTMASADSPPGYPGRVSPGKNALLLGATAAFTSATEPIDFAVLCQLVASRRPYYAVLVHRPARFP